VPLYHCFGMVIGNLACACSGAAAVYPAESFSPEATLAAVAAEGCTSLYGVPTMFIAELALPRWAGEACPPASPPACFLACLQKGRKLALQRRDAALMGPVNCCPLCQRGRGP
jgi:acyl-CoA synthetase (AMP-forming)/AMP-acid ligase II